MSKASQAKFKSKQAPCAANTFKGSTLEPDTVYIFTDGASSTKPRAIGGWGVLMVYNNLRRELMGGAPGKTNNQMELQAILEGMDAMQRVDLPVKVVTDSKYAINCLTNYIYKWERNGWTNTSGNPVKNRDIIEVAASILREFDDLEMMWVKGHSKNPYNDRADELAGFAKSRYGYEAGRYEPGGVIDFSQVRKKRAIQ